MIMMSVCASVKEEIPSAFYYYLFECVQNCECLPFIIHLCVLKKEQQRRQKNEQKTTPSKDDPLQELVAKKRVLSSPLPKP